MQVIASALALVGSGRVRAREYACRRIDYRIVLLCWL